MGSKKDNFFQTVGLGPEALEKMNSSLGSNPFLEEFGVLMFSMCIPSGCTYIDFRQHIQQTVGTMFNVTISESSCTTDDPLEANVEFPFNARLAM